MATVVKKRKTGGHREAQRRAKQHRRAERHVVNERERIIAAAAPIEDLPNVDPAETMQLLINRVERLWRYAAAQVDALRPGIAPNQSPENMDHELWVAWDDNNNLVVTSSYWIEREKQLSELLGRLTESAQRIGLGERLARAKEQQITILGEALRAACLAIGMPERMQRELGAALDQQLLEPAIDVEARAA